MNHAKADRLAGLVLAMIVALTACADSEGDGVSSATTAPAIAASTGPAITEPGPTDPGATEPSTPASPNPTDTRAPTEADGSTRVTSADDLVDTEPVSISDLVVDPDNDSQLLVRFDAAPRACGKYRATVTETETEVRVQIEGGIPAELENETVGCVSIGTLFTMAVPLTAPAGDRTLTALLPDDIDDTHHEPRDAERRRIQSRDDLAQPRPVEIGEVLTDPADPNTVLVQFSGGAEPCSGFQASAVETPDSVTIKVVSGLTPEAATTTCPGTQVDYEIAVNLQAPVAARILAAAVTDEN